MRSEGPARGIQHVVASVARQRPDQAGDRESDIEGNQIIRIRFFVEGVSALEPVAIVKEKAVLEAFLLLDREARSVGDEGFRESKVIGEG